MSLQQRFLDVRLRVASFVALLQDSPRKREIARRIWPLWKRPALWLIRVGELARERGSQITTRDIFADGLLWVIGWRAEWRRGGIRAETSAEAFSRVMKAMTLEFTRSLTTIAQALDAQAAATREMTRALNAAFRSSSR